MIAQFRAFLVVLEEGSLHRAAARLRLSQSALSRQMQALEQELGGRLLDRTSTGVRPTNGGYALAAKITEVLSSYDATMVEVRQLVRGESTQLRIGCVASAIRDHLEPALKALRQSNPEAKIKLLDLSPGEQIKALRSGKIDVAFLDQGDDILSRDFYVRKIDVISSLVIFPGSHPLARRREVKLAELKQETFVSGTDADMPGYNRRVAEFCRKLGKFRPKFIGQPQSLSEGLALVANEDAILLLPSYVRHQASSCITMVPIADKEATWDLFIVWQRGQTTGPLRALLQLFPAYQR